MKRALASTFRSYTELLRIRGAQGFVLAGFIGRFPISMRSLAALLLVLNTSGSYKLAGAVAAVVTLTTAAAVPVLGRLADRNSQSRVLFSALAVHVSGIVGLVVLTEVSAPTWTFFIPAAVFGASALPFGSFVRARWAALLSGTPRLTTAYALEAFIDDIIYITGPVIVTFLAAKVFASASMLAILAFVAIGWVGLALQRSTQPTVGPRSEMPEKMVVSEAGVRALLLVCFTLGMWFGASNVAMVAFAEEHGDPGMGGVLIGLTVFSGMIAGLVYGGITWRSDTVLRLIATSAILGASTLLLLTGDSFAVMAPLALVAGVGITPTLIGIYALLGNLVSTTAVTEGFAWIASSITIGISAGTVATGFLVDNAGSFGAFAFLAGCGVGLPAVVALGRNFLGRTPHRAATSRPMEPGGTP